MNCKPGQMAMIKTASRMGPCSALRLGVPVTVSHIVTPLSMGQVVHEALEGPVWMLAEPLRCPHRNTHCPGIDRMPDACLRPFDPDSLPDRMATRSASPSLSQVVTHSHFSPPDQQTPGGLQSSPATRNSPRHLNPLFGAWLMGWPSTWVIAEPHASSASATALFRRKQASLLCSLLGEPNRGLCDE